jgi:hypothetical protein
MMRDIPGTAGCDEGVVDLCRGSFLFFLVGGFGLMTGQMVL